MTQKSRIKQLPEDLVTRIAAGEVIERPSSVLKECLENAIDAGATDISIIVEGAGRTRIQISDNGCGMTPEEAEMSLKRHSTSKISSLQDLETISTFGFRGEALPSVASVSRLRLTTRPEGAETGWEIVLEGGKILSKKISAHKKGTTLEIKDLFFNTPARFKFLKSDGTERGHCLRVIEEMALASPQVQVHVQMDKGKPTVFQPQRDQPFSKRVQSIWGNRFSQVLLPVEATSPHFKLRGVVTDAYSHQGTTRLQYLFVNKRPVSHRGIARAIYEGFMGHLPTQRHPAWALFLEVDPKTVDVNVHPSKREVKLTHENEIFGFVLDSIRKTLSSPVTVGGSVSVENRPSLDRRVPPLASWTPKPNLEQYANVYRPLPSTPGAEPTSFLDQPLLDPLTVKGKTLQALAQLKKMFILAQSENSLVIIDQHAAAERVSYERLFRKEKEAKPDTQLLLVPYTWEVARSIKSGILEKLSMFTKMGFLIESFGDNAFLIKGVPSILGEKVDLGSFLDGVSEFLSAKDFQHKLASAAACKGSIRAGDVLDQREMQAVLDQLTQSEAP